MPRRRSSSTTKRHYRRRSRLSRHRQQRGSPTQNDNREQTIFADAYDDARSRLREAQPNLGNADEKLDLEKVDVATFYQTIGVVNSRWVDAVTPLNISRDSLYSMLVGGILRSKGQTQQFHKLLRVLRTRGQAEIADVLEK